MCASMGATYCDVVLHALHDAGEELEVTGRERVGVWLRHCVEED